MFLALRELRFARGRFTLMGAVIALISVLVVLLSGLSSGLVNDGVSGLKSMPVTAFAFDEGTMKDNAFSRSVIDDDQLNTWRQAEGVNAAEPMGVNIVNAVTDAGPRSTWLCSASSRTDSSHRQSHPASRSGPLTESSCRSRCATKE